MTRSRAAFPLLSLSLLAFFAAPPAQAQDATTQDLRCLVIAIEMSGSVDAQIRASATTVGAYFLGRLDGRTPDLDVQTRAAQEMMRMKPEDLDPEVDRCTALMGVRAQVIGALAARLAGQTR
jgi:hypothetical protein